MKIGIVTPYEEANYGAYLQAYDTKIFLENEGHDVFFVKWRSEYVRKKAFYINSTNMKAFIKKLIHYKHNHKNYISMTESLKEFKTINMKDINDAKLDCIILGSDEIWNITMKIFQKEVFFGGGFNETPILAYAPSAGNATISDFEGYNNIINLVNNVNVIGVRDENTRNLINDMRSYSTEIVCDPTLLICSKDYMVKKNTSIKDKYILIYAYYVSPEMRDNLILFAKEKGIKTVSACMYQSWCDINIACEPLEFISLIQNAEYVFTTTFHGSIFTFMNHKKCAIQVPSKKLLDLIKWTGMDSAIIDSQDYEKLNYTLNQEYDYEKFEENISKRREKSAKLYREALSTLKI